LVNFEPISLFAKLSLLECGVVLSVLFVRNNFLMKEVFFGLDINVSFKDAGCGMVVVVVVVGIGFEY